MGHEVTNERIISEKFAVLWGKAGVCQTTSLVQLGNSRLLVKIIFLEEAETAVRLGMDSWFADVGLGTDNCVLGLSSHS